MTYAIFRLKKHHWTRPQEHIKFYYVVHDHIHTCTVRLYSNLIKIVLGYRDTIRVAVPVEHVTTAVVWCCIAMIVPSCVPESMRQLVELQQLDGHRAQLADKRALGWCGVTLHWHVSMYIYIKVAKQRINLTGDGRCHGWSASVLKQPRLVEADVHYLLISSTCRYFLFRFNLYVLHCLLWEESCLCSWFRWSDVVGEYDDDECLFDFVCHDCVTLQMPFCVWRGT